MTIEQAIEQLSPMMYSPHYASALRAILERLVEPQERLREAATTLAREVHHEWGQREDMGLLVRQAYDAVVAALAQPQGQVEADPNT